MLQEGHRSAFKLALEATKEACFLPGSPLAGEDFLSPGRAGSTGISSSSAPGRGRDKDKH